MPVAIVGVGVVTSVGLSLPEAEAAVRAGSARFSEGPFRDRRAEALVMATVPEEALPPLDPKIDDQDGVSTRERRMLRLAAQALSQCLRVLPKAVTSVPVSIALPHSDGPIPIDGKAFVERLAVQSTAPLAIPKSVARHRGRAGGLLALGEALELLAAGATRYIIAGGVDSHRDGRTIGALDAARRVKSSSNLDAFIPGEAAALLLLTNESQARQDGLPCLAMCSPSALAYEDGHLFSSTPYRGEALATALAQLASSGSIAAPIGEVYSSMNGEHHWGREWSIAFMRHRALFDPSHGFHHPADAYGDIGAAAGPMMVALAAIGQQKHYRRTPALVYCSSDDGPRAALCVLQA